MSLRTEGLLFVLETSGTLTRSSYNQLVPVLGSYLSSLDVSRTSN